MKKFFNDFMAFAMKGNVMDLAIAVIIGAAFGKIVTSLVTDIITPVIGLLIGGIDIQDWKLGLFSVGDFLQNVIDFIIIAFVIFLFIEGIKRLRRHPPAVPPPAMPAREEVLLTEIRDLLKEGKKA
jgi:large conductance mechanosensitive channel